MDNFEKLAFHEVCEALAATDTRLAPDIYVLSFHIFDLGDDPRRPILQLGYNTRTRLKECTPSEGREPTWPVASSASEAKWNFAFWLQNELKFIGEPGTESGQLLEDALKRRGFWYSDDDEEADFERCEHIGSEVTTCFMESCARVARELHTSGIVERRFGTPIPIVVHQLDYDDRIALLTRLANPPGLAEEFAAWIAGM